MWARILLVQLSNMTFCVPTVAICHWTPAVNSAIMELGQIGEPSSCNDHDQQGSQCTKRKSSLERCTSKHSLGKACLPERPGQGVISSRKNPSLTTVVGKLCDTFIGGLTWNMAN